MIPSQDLRQEPADDMPPLVEPPSTMTYTFLTEMAPLSLHPTPPLEATFTSTAPTATIEELDSYEQTYTFSGPARTYHGKRRDASYIPRPPNAFILFRSSFIREHQVPMNVEGKYWKNLSKSERDTWEAKAAQAQVEHRHRYPDWRFQPGANAAANAKRRRYVLDSGGGDGSGGGMRRRARPGIRGTKDPPDRGRDEESQEVEIWEDEEEDMDNDDDSDYEESSSRRKRKGKRKSVKASSTRRQRPTKKVVNENVELSKSNAKAPSITPRDKERDEERIEKIVGFLVEGKKGAELEEAVEEWEQRIDEEKDKNPPEKIDAQAPCNNKTMPLPRIITVNPSSPSSLMVAPTPPSPTVSLLSPASPLSPTVPPPSSPELYPEEVHGQAQEMKRSFSAPAPGMRVGVPQAQNQIQDQDWFMHAGWQGQLGYRHSHGAGGMRKRHFSSASVPGSIRVDVTGERNKEISRRETVSLPLSRMDACPRRREFDNLPGQVSGPTTQTLNVHGQDILAVSASIKGLPVSTIPASVFAGEGGYLPVGSNFRIVSDVPSASTTSNAINYAYTTSASPPSTLTPSWDQQHRQAQEVQYEDTSTSWWSPAGSMPPDSRATNEQSVPVREGSFEQPYEYGYPYDYGPGGVEYDRVYVEEMGRSFQNFPVNAAQEMAVYPSVMHREREDEHEQQWSSPISSSLMESKHVIYASSTPGSTLTSTPHVHEINEDISTDSNVNTGADAGMYFRPLVPSRITVPSSTFSSLTGWDGSKSEESAEGDTSGSKDVGSTGYKGIRDGREGQTQGQGPGSSYGWGTIQSVGLAGLGGGERWDNTDEGMSVVAGTSGGERCETCVDAGGGGDVTC